MTTLNDDMKDCLIEVDQKSPDSSFEDTVLEAVWLYELRHEPIEFVNEEEAEEFYRKALAFVLDCTLLGMVRKGIIEVEGVDPDGEFVYKATIEMDMEPVQCTGIKEKEESWLRKLLLFIRTRAARRGLNRLTSGNWRGLSRT